MSYFEKFDELEKPKPELDGIVLEVDDPRDEVVLDAIRDGQDFSFTKKIREADADAWNAELWKLGYGMGMQQFGEVNIIRYHKEHWASDYMIVSHVKKHPEKFMDAILDRDRLFEDDIYLFMALVEDPDEDERNYLVKAIQSQNRGFSASNRQNGFDNSQPLRLVKGLIKDINVLAQRVGLEQVRYNPTYGDTDFNCSFEDIDNDAKHRADLLLELICKNPLRGKSQLYVHAYDVVIGATRHLSRWYNVKRDPFVHFYVLKGYPEKMKLKQDFVNAYLGIYKESPFPYTDNKIIGASIISRAKRAVNGS